MLRQIILCTLLTLTLAGDLPSFLRQRFSRITPCAGRCLFRFCADVSRVLLTAPGNVSGPEICRADLEINRILETSEAMVAVGVEKVLVPISEWMPAGLDTPFSPDVFKAATIFGEDHSGIQRTIMQGNQNKFLMDSCVVLPITRYERVRRFRGRERIVSVIGKRPVRDCIAFRPRVFDILFEVQWLSGDDLDISVVEPDGTLLDLLHPRSGCGRHIGDGGVDICEVRKEFIERIEYPKDCAELQRGAYTIRVKHASNCRLTDPPEPTRYEVRVVVDGILQNKVFGVSSRDNNEIVTTFLHVI